LKLGDPGVPISRPIPTRGTMPARGIPQIKMPDHELIDARYTISTLQTALDRATALVRELQTTVGALNERVAIGNEQIEDLALDLAMERLRAEIADTADAASPDMAEGCLLLPSCCAKWRPFHAVVWIDLTRDIRPRR